MTWYGNIYSANSNEQMYTKLMGKLCGNHENEASYIVEIWSVEL